MTGWRTLCSGVDAHGEGLEEYSTNVAPGLSVTSWKVLFHCCRDRSSKDLAQAKARLLLEKLAVEARGDFPYSKCGRGEVE